MRLLFIIHLFFYVMQAVACDVIFFNNQGKEIPLVSEEYSILNIRNTSLILWVSLKESKKNLRDNYSYQFDIKEILKGEYNGSSISMDIFSEPPKKKISQNFHAKQVVRGRTYLKGDCSYSKPYGFVGESYLLFVGTEFDKMFEQVDSKEDAWYKFVKKNIQTPVPSDPNLKKK